MKAARTMSWRMTLPLLVALVIAAAPPAEAGFTLSVGTDDFYFSIGHYDYFPYYSYGETIEFGYHDLLDRHGVWQYVPSMGVELWFPHVDLSWRPYLHGHWIRTAHGMTWVAYEPWGWIPHHYGRWVCIDDLGWGWVPGYEYGPGWVTWGVVEEYVGWAPLPPAGFRYPRHRTYRYGADPSWYHHGRHYAYHPSGIDFSLWVFVSNRHFYNKNVHVHSLPPSSCARFFETGRVLPVGTRIDVNYVRRVTRAPLRTVRTERQVYNMGGRRLVHYRPYGQKAQIRKGERTVGRVLGKPLGGGERYRSGVDKSKRTTKSRYPERKKKVDRGKTRSDFVPAQEKRALKREAESSRRRDAAKPRSSKNKRR